MSDPKFETMRDKWRYTIKMTNVAGGTLTVTMSVDEARELLREMSGDFDYTLCDGYCHENRS